MPKNDILTSADMADFTPNPEIMRYVLEEC